MGNSSSVQTYRKRLELPVERIDSAKMSREVYRKIVQFLSLKDILNLGATCKLYCEYQEHHQLPFAIHYYNMFLNEQITMSLEFSYPDIEVRNQIRNTIFQNTKFRWLNQIKAMYHAKKTIKFPLYFCEMQFPKPILRRETIGTYCETEHQVMLAQRLELEQKGFDKSFDAQMISDKLMKQLKENKNEIILKTVQHFKENEQASRLFFCNRWQLDSQFNDHYGCIIAELLDTLVRTVETYLIGLSEYLIQFAKFQVINAIDLISEYVMYWQAYSNAILEMQSVMIPFEEIINEVHKVIYKQYPQYPKFSIWRLLTKLWIKHILRNPEEYQTILIECFLKLMKSLRQTQLNTEFENKNNGQMLMDEPSVNITHELYDNFMKHKKCSVNIIYNIESTHPCYTETTELISSFIKCLQDISVSEVAVHWVGHTDCAYEDIYDQFQKRILEESSHYYDQHKNIFEDNLPQYINFLFMDQKFIQTFAMETLQFQIATLQKEHVYTQMQILLKNKHINDFICNNEDLIIKIYNQQNSTPKIDRLSIGSSLQNNEHLETQGDQMDLHKLFTFVLENQNVDLDEMMLQEKQKIEPEALYDIIKVCLQEMHIEIDMIVNQDIPPMPMMMQPLKRSYSSLKNLNQNVDIPDELIKAVKSQALEDKYFRDAYEKLQEFERAYDKFMIKCTQKDREIELINEDRELPKNLPVYLQDFYYVSSCLTQEKLDNNTAEVDQNQVNESDELEIEGPSLSKTSSKVQSKLYENSYVEEYNSEGEQDSFDQFEH